MANLAKNHSDFYWWMDTDFHYGDFSVPKFALFCMGYDEDGNKDKDTEDRVICAAYEDVPGFNEADDFTQAQWDAIDAYIISKLGFLPDYDVN